MEQQLDQNDFCGFEEDGVEEIEHDEEEKVDFVLEGTRLDVDGEVGNEDMKL